MGNVEIFSFTELDILCTILQHCHSSTFMSSLFFPDIKLKGTIQRIEKSYFFTLLNGDTLNPVVFINIK